MWVPIWAAAAVLALVPTLALAAFPGTNPAESVRINTPNDPRFDRCEPDDEQGPPTCTNVFDQDFERFGFAPNGSQTTALFHNPADGHVQRFMAQNTAAGRNPLGQLPGVSVDRAWKYTIGDPSVQVAILDTGIEWSRDSIRKRVWLNEDELPVPNHSGSPLDPSVSAADCANYVAAYDANGDGAVNVLDYACDSRVSITTGGRHGAAGKITAEDLILDLDFSDGTDADGNGYIDDIAGWDFFDDDNNSYDGSSYSSADNHGSDRAEEAAEEGNDGAGGLGLCPKCQVVPMRTWDTFVSDTNNLAQASVYAADNGIEVVESANGGLFNSRFARSAFDYAYRKGVFFAIVSSDLNTANHNIPTVYNESLMVQGTVADVHGLGDNPPQEFIDFFNMAGVPLQTNAPIQTWFRNSGTTQYGGHAHIAMPAPTGSQATGQASGAAGLLESHARKKGTSLAPNEVKQLLTLTAFDVDQPDTAGLGVPDPAQPGWDQHFGYGVPDIGLAMEKIDQGKIPPQVLITAPQWFAPLNANQLNSIDIQARLAAPRAGDNYTYRLQWAPGIQPAEGAFIDVATQPQSAAFEGSVGTINLQQVRAALDALPNGGATADPTAPGKGPGDKDPNEPAFTVRVVVTDGAGNRGEDRKVLFDYRDTTLHKGYSKDLGGGGEASPRMFDLNGDNKLETVMPDSSGQLHVFNDDGTPLSSFNGGAPVKALPYPNVHPAAPVYAQVEPPREVMRTPAIGDIDGDGVPEIVDSAGEHVYAWHADGSAVAGFPVRLNPAFSLPQDRTRQNHVKRGFSASPALGDLNGDGKLEIVVPGLDQHLYVWDGSGHALQGFPKLLKDGAASVAGAEIINSAAVGDINGDGKAEIATPTAEFDANPSAPPTPTEGAVGGFGNFLTNVLANVLGGAGRVYAVDRNGNVLSGWPTKPNGIVPDALPFVGPGVDHIMADVNGDGKLDVIGNVATGDLTATNADGSNAVTYDSQQPAGAETVDHSKVINLFEHPIAANIDGLPGLEIIKGGLTLQGLVNVGVAVGQNLPYNHVLQAWNAQTGASLPTFPQAVEDYQLLSSPVVADVADAPGNEVVVGTGLYYLRGFNVAGVEGAGFPKFTGGWLYATPAVGDTDGDGKLEITTITREGHMFTWDTNSPACGTNDEWWTSRHDEWGTGAYGTDARPPGAPYNAALPHGQHVTFTAPGDDWLCGTAHRYEVRTSPHPITAENFAHATPVATPTPPAPAAAGTQQTAALPAGASGYAAIRAVDEQGNVGRPLTFALAGAQGHAGALGAGLAGAGAGAAGIFGPVIRSLSLLRSRFRLGAGGTALSAQRRRRATPRGTEFRYTLNKAATVRIRIERLLPGRRVGRKCKAPTRRRRSRPRCTRFSFAGTLIRRANAGANRTSFTGRLGRRALSSGSYRATATAVDAAGRVSAPRRVSFTIVRR